MSEVSFALAGAELGPSYRPRNDAHPLRELYQRAELQALV